MGIKPLDERVKFPLIGIAVGLVAIVLSMFGNPANMALCIACFLRDMAGAVGMHRAQAVQYMRPEVIGIVLGAFAVSLFKKDYAAKGGSAPFSRFVLGASTMVGALIFLGCPLRMLLRIGGGDLNAVVGLVGFVAGIGGGALLLNNGFSLQRTYTLPKSEGALLPLVNVLLLVLLLAAPSVLVFSTSGPGSMHAPAFISLAAGLLIGVMGQRSRLCFISGVRDAMLFRQWHMVLAFVALIATVLIGNLARGTFHLSFTGQPVAHTAFVWNFLGMALVGICSVMLGGCPYRQLILAGSGNTDSAITVLGMFVGAAFAHNLNLASSTEGPTLNGKIAFAVCLAAVLGIAFTNIKKVKAKA